MIAKDKKIEIPGTNSNGKNWGRGISVVTLRGKTNHFGIDITQTVPQYIDPFYYYVAMKPTVDAMIRQLTGGLAGFENAMVITVGKSWASMHDGRLPHGDPGALAISNPQAGIGPVYFNEAVAPDPACTRTSVDGGVVWFNVAAGQYLVTAQKVSG